MFSPGGKISHRFLLAEIIIPRSVIIPSSCHNYPVAVILDFEGNFRPAEVGCCHACMPACLHAVFCVLTFSLFVHMHIALCLDSIATAHSARQARVCGRASSLDSE